MAVQKLSVSLDEKVVARARRAAEREGLSLSAWLSKAAEEAAELAEARAALEEYIATYGEPDLETAAAARAELEAVGWGKPIPPEDIEANRAALARLRGEIPPANDTEAIGESTQEPTDKQYRKAG
ncbi:hypothetical protein [Carbonactinospora thermoautotrophica]|uniref:hypothetical protein n=1 Tax=Carbonactinospora thermoautotrophica TaxID=1469144 RepID=UPI000A70434C|nr:hypothetical protein [Carbonactinospora thermoautotrophica]